MSEPDVVALKAGVARLSTGAQRLRERFNTGRRLKAIWKQRQHFNSICSAMDVVGDCCFAMYGYLDHLQTATDDKDFNYLIIYGLMNALYLQQDAVFYWGKYLGLKPYSNYKKPGGWAMDIPALRIVREARNDATGHPVHRELGSDVCAFFIAHMSVERDGFSLMQTIPGSTSKFRSVSLLALIEKQVPTMAQLLEDAATALDAQDREHYRKFMNQPLTRILEDLNYHREKLSSRESESDFLMMPVAIKEIRKGIQRLEDAVEHRGEPFENMWTFLARRLRRALTALDAYVADDKTVDGDLAEVLCDYVRTGIDRLKELTTEMDARYRQGGA